MKKITLLGALVVAGMATAQVQVAPEQLKLQKVEPQRVEMQSEVTMAQWDGKAYAAKKTANADYDGVDYYYVEGMLHGGLTSDWGGYAPMMMLPAYADSTDLLWKNTKGATTWTHPSTGAVWAESTEVYGSGMYPTGLFYLPKTTDHVLTADDGTQQNIKGYIYGAAKTNQYLVVGCNHTVLGDGTIIPMTLCGMYCDPYYNAKGSDFYIINAEKSLGCPYAYGTDLVYEGKSFDTIVSVVRNLNPMKIDQINMPVYNASGAELAKVLPEGAQVKVELIAVDLVKGEIYPDSVYASTVIDTADCVDLGSGQLSLVAKFYEEDIFGGVQQVSVVVPGDFGTRITGYNESNCDFGFLSDNYTEVGNTTLFEVDGKYTTLWKAGNNLAISYEGYWPVAYNPVEDNVMVAPVEGGKAVSGEYANLTLYTNVMDQDAWVIEDTPEWLECELVFDYLESDEAVLFTATATALTDEEYREGVVTVNVDGFVYEVLVTQGTAPTGVENVTAPVFSGKAYNLLGVEVDENYKGIVIKNGQKTIQ